MKHVLHVIDHLGLGGAQSALLDLVANRDEDHWQCEVAAMHGRGVFATALENCGVRVHSLATSRWSGAYVPRFLALLRNGKFEVLHFHLQGANWIAKPLAALSCDAVRVAHDHASGDLRFRGFSSLLPDALAHLFSHHVIGVSPGVTQFLHRYEALPSEKMSVVPNGIDTKNFHPPLYEQRRAARAKWGLGNEEFCVGALGRLAPEKNFVLLAEVCRMVPEAQVVLGGEGPERDRIEAAFRTVSTSKQLHLCGSISDRAEFFAALDVLVIPSLYEGLPMVLLEAMASGVPVVASHLPDIAAALGTCGLLADPSKPETFAEALTFLRQNPKNSSQLSVAARNRCQNHFSATSTARKVESIYKKFVQDL